MIVQRIKGYTNRRGDPATDDYWLASGSACGSTLLAEGYTREQAMRSYTILMKSCIERHLANQDYYHGH